MRAGGEVRPRRGQPWLLIAKAGPEAIARLGPGGAPGVGPDRPDERGGEGRRGRALRPRRTGAAPLARPARRADRAAQPGFVEPMLATPGSGAVRRRGLALRAQVGRLPDPGDRRPPAACAPDTQPPRRGTPIPRAAREADLARSAGGDRRRRGRRARRRGPSRLRPAPGAPRGRLQRPRTSPRAAPRARRAGPRRSSSWPSTCPWCAGRSYLDVPLEERKAVLRLVLRDHPRVRFGGHVERDGVAFFAAAAAQGLEGAMAKHRRSRYEAGHRSAAWLKLKVRPTQELVVAGYVPRPGQPPGPRGAHRRRHGRAADSATRAASGAAWTRRPAPASARRSMPARAGLAAVRARRPASWRGRRGSSGPSPSW